MVSQGQPPLGPEITPVEPDLGNASAGKNRRSPTPTPGKKQAGQSLPVVDLTLVGADHDLTTSRPFPAFFVLTVRCPAFRAELRVLTHSSFAATQSVLEVFEKANNVKLQFSAGATPGRR